MSRWDFLYLTFEIKNSEIQDLESSQGLLVTNTQPSSGPNGAKPIDTNITRDFRSSANRTAYQLFHIYHVCSTALSFVSHWIFISFTTTLEFCIRVTMFSDGTGLLKYKWSKLVRPTR